MKLYYRILLIVVFFSFNEMVMAQTFNWVTPFSSGRSYSIQADNNGNVFVGGSFSNTADFDLSNPGMSNVSKK